MPRYTSIMDDREQQLRLINQEKDDLRKRNMQRLFLNMKYCGIDMQFWSNMALNIIHEELDSTEEEWSETIVRSEKNRVVIRDNKIMEEMAFLNPVPLDCETENGAPINVSGRRNRNENGNGTENGQVKREDDNESGYESARPPPPVTPMETSVTVASVNIPATLNVPPDIPVTLSFIQKVNNEEGGQVQGQKSGATNSVEGFVTTGETLVATPAAGTSTEIASSSKTAAAAAEGNDNFDFAVESMFAEVRNASGADNKEGEEEKEEEGGRKLNKRKKNPSEKDASNSGNVSDASDGSPSLLNPSGKRKENDSNSANGDNNGKRFVTKKRQKMTSDFKKLILYNNKQKERDISRVFAGDDGAFATKDSITIETDNEEEDETVIFDDDLTEEFVDETSSDTGATGNNDSWSDADFDSLDWTTRKEANKTSTPKNSPKKDSPKNKKKPCCGWLNAKESRLKEILQRPSILRKQEQSHASASTSSAPTPAPPRKRKQSFSAIEMEGEPDDDVLIEKKQSTTVAAKKQKKSDEEDNDILAATQRGLTAMHSSFEKMAKQMMKAADEMKQLVETSKVVINI